MDKEITVFKKRFSIAYLAWYVLSVLMVKTVETNLANAKIVNDNMIKLAYNFIEPMNMHQQSLMSFLANDEFHNTILSVHEDDLNSNYTILNSSSVSTDKEMWSERAPPSYSILMNFQNDGTTSLQVFANNVIYWNDKGLCKHGQMFDPSISQCRDVFCMEGFIFTQEGCKPNQDNNATQTYNPDATSIPNDLEIEVTLLNRICSDRSEKCSDTLLMDSPEDFIEEFRLTLSKNLHINSTRISRLNILFNDSLELNFLSNSSSSTSIETDEDNIQSETNVTRTYERIKLTFTVKDNKDYPDDNEETLMLYYMLVKLSMDYYEFELYNKKIVICNVTENKSSQKWCSAPDSYMLKVNGFSILASFDNNGKAKYYVYLNETDTVYGTGDFYLSIGYIPKSLDFNFTKDGFEKHIQLKNFANLQDVTNVVLGANAQDGLMVSKMLTVCNRYPRISTTCPDHQTIRIKTCELKQLLNRTYCYMEKCYFINEYEYDTEEPDHIRVCKFKKEKENATLSYDADKIKIASTIQGYMSFISNILSVTAMLLTLITFALFNELRNIPGWNCINLTLALTIAQISFLVGGLVRPLPTVCLIAAIMTHYGFLCAFSWMSVIAFDLYRNFRRKSSHILIHMVNLKSRLIKYAAYAWLSPLVTVGICLIIDVTVNNRKNFFKPCYAAYFEGCSSSETLSFKNSQNKKTINGSKSVFGEKLANETLTPCIAAGSEPSYVNPIVLQQCWIQNGNANLLFFGAPIGIIIIVNAVFYILAIYNIRKKKQNQRHNKMRRFSRVKCPGDDDIKFYIRMAVIMGFTWIIGFFLTTFSTESPEFKIINEILIYAFILCNASMGVFIFFVFIFKREVKELYIALLKGKKNQSVLENSKTTSTFTKLQENLVSIKGSIKKLFSRKKRNESQCSEDASF